MHARTFNRNALSSGFYLLIVILSPAIMFGCAGHSGPASATHATPSNQTETRDAAPPSSLPSPTPAAAAVSSPPQPQEVDAAVTRVYQTAVVADEGGRASTLTGDFNGDDSQDIAIIVKPNKAMLSEINSEFANWTVEDPRHVLTPPQAARVDQAKTPAPARAQVEAGETLLAVIHGYQSEGWRNPHAKQTYLLKNANGSEMRTQTGAEARRISKEAADHHMPYVRGDLICQVLDGKAGCLYWTGAKYGWHNQTPYQPTAKAKANGASPAQ
jgi:hypothetical protein